MAKKNLSFLYAATICISVVCSQPSAYAQNQLVLLKREKVILRLSFGDEFVYKAKGSKEKVYSYVNNLFDTAVQVHRTIVPFHKIDRIYFVRTNFANIIGGGLVTGGLGYFLIDQINEVLVQGHDPTLDENVTVVSAAMVAAGLPLMLIKKRSPRIGRKLRLMTVGPDSHFYQKELDRMGF